MSIFHFIIRLSKSFFLKAFKLLFWKNIFKPRSTFPSHFQLKPIIICFLVTRWLISHTPSLTENPQSIFVTLFEKVHVLIQLPLFELGGVNWSEKEVSVNMFSTSISPFFEMMVEVLKYMIFILIIFPAFLNIFRLVWKGGRICSLRLYRIKKKIFHQVMQNCKIPPVTIINLGIWELLKLFFLWL